MMAKNKLSNLINVANSNCRKVDFFERRCRRLDRGLDVGRDVLPGVADHEDEAEDVDEAEDQKPEDRVEPEQRSLGQVPDIREPRGYV